MCEHTLRALATALFRSVCEIRYFSFAPDLSVGVDGARCGVPLATPHGGADRASNRRQPWR